MLIPTANRKAIYQNLFKEGVIVAEKDFNLPAHSSDELKAIPNLQVIKACQSLRSRGYVKEQFAWRHYYWYLTDEGIAYLREYLHLPSEVVPDTHTPKARANAPAPTRGGPRGAAGGYRRDDSGRDGYRRDGEAKTGTDDTFQPKFRGGYGRGAPQ